MAEPRGHDAGPPALGLRVDVRVRGAGALRAAADGPALGVLGPTGVGKSTLLRVIAGVEPGVEGTVVALGEPWLDGARARPPWARGVGWAPQDALLFPQADVRGQLQWRPGGPVDEVARLLEIEGLLNRTPRHLSGGERQRVALGRALCARPRLLLLDEPFAALDRPTRARLRAAVAAWCRDHRLPVVIVTHEEADLEPFGAARLELQPGG